MNKKIYIGLHDRNTLFSKLIKWFTRNRYSHATLCFEDGSVIDGYYGGVKMNSKYPISKNDIIDIYSVEVTDEQYNAILNFSKDKLGAKYDWTMILRFLSREDESENSKNKWFCAELVFAAFLAAGIKLLNNTEAWKVSPAMLSLSTLLKYEHTINDDGKITRVQ